MVRAGNDIVGVGALVVVPASPGQRVAPCAEEDGTAYQSNVRLSPGRT